MTTESLLPPNAAAAERALELAAARVGDVDAPIRRLWNPAACPAGWLPFLAWAFSVDVWDSSWPESVRRQVVASAIAVHRRKGTLGALEDALAALDLDAAVSQWFDYGGDPYRFKVDASIYGRAMTETEITTIGAVIEGVKNERSVLDQLRVFLAARGGVPRIAAAMLSGEETSLYPPVVTEIEARAGVPVVAVGCYGVETATLFPREV